MKNKRYANEAIYIAGPICFYTDGFSQLGMMRHQAELLGFQVTLPNDHPLDMENPDKQKRADSIMADLEAVMNETTVIVSDLEAYRGSEADSGTIYEIGMAYAQGARSYAFTRDKRPLTHKDQNYRLVNGDIWDEHGQVAPYPHLPFSPHIIGSTKIVQGDFTDCMDMLMTDIDEEDKAGNRQVPLPLFEKKSVSENPRVYISILQRYASNKQSQYDVVTALCAQHGLTAVFPPVNQEENPYRNAAVGAKQALEALSSCDAIIADLNDYRGYECANDIAFECGMAFQLRKRLFGFMSDTTPTIDRIPHYGADHENREFTGSNVEDFNYAANLMFGSTMPILQGDLGTVIADIANQLTEKE